MKKKLLLSLALFCLTFGLKAAAEAPLKAVWSTTDHLVSQQQHTLPPAAGKNHRLTAWRGERLHAQVLVWASTGDGQLSFAVEEPRDTRWMDEATTGFVRYVMTDELNKDGKGGCGHRPDKTKYDSLLVADRIDPAPTTPYKAGTVQPLWLTFEVPHDAKPGLYRGSVSIRREGQECATLPYSIRVIDRTLPQASSQKFHLDLWQNPFAVARTAGTPLWSKAHFDAMQPLMQRLARAGQRGITATITHKPWNGQTYDYFEDMITVIKRADGTWTYDYTVFDRWVEFMQDCGVGPYIYCYSVIPWELTFRYHDQATNATVDRKIGVDSPEFDEYWVNKLKAFAAHLKEKGWFKHTFIAMDERPEKSMKAALRVIRKADPDYKISLAGNYHESLNNELADLCIPYYAKYPDGVVDARRKAGRITTFYTCCMEPYPNTFTFSQPAEATALALVAAQRNLDGYLRWAYNSWVEHPNQDSRFHTWAAGDTYIVYAPNQSSVRFEKLTEGIQMFEKIQILKADPRHARNIERLLQPFAYDRFKVADLPKNIKKLNAYLNAI